MSKLPISAATVRLRLFATARPADGATAGDLAARLEPGRLAFNSGDFHGAHELWEDVWRAPRGASEAMLVQGLIQIAAGMHHAGRGRPRPAATLLAKGLHKLRTAGAPPGEAGGLRFDLFAQVVAAFRDTLPAPHR